MNIPSLLSVNATASYAITTSKTLLLYATVQNSGGSDLFVTLSDLPAGAALPTQGQRIGRGDPIRIAAGATYSPFSLDAIGGRVFERGCLLEGWVDAQTTIPGAAVLNVTAWVAALQ